ncbi:peptidoglycan DD-metalloendopeptidase family protein [Lysobacter sp. A378]
MTRSRRLVPGLAIALMGIVPIALAGTLYRWTDANGVNHYGDRQLRDTAPPVESGRIPAFVEPTAIARLRIEARGSEYYVWADNQLSGPIEVMLHYRHHRNTTSDPALPARATVHTGGSTVVSVLRATDPGQPVDFDLRMDSLPGNPSAAPGDTTYLLPVARDTAEIDQGYGGTFSHDDPENRYAVDFAVPVGTPVLAARGGVVMQLEEGFERTSLDRDAYAGRANFIRLLHDDGAMSLYAHLQVDGVLVQAGQRVTAGQQIGLSGNTGFTTGPHLHFVVQVNRGMRLVSLPFRMQGVEIEPSRPAAALSSDVAGG